MAPAAKPVSPEEALDFLKDVLRDSNPEATVFAPGQNQDLMDALGAILSEISIAKVSQPNDKAVPTSKKKLMDPLGDLLSDSNLDVNQSKRLVPVGNVATTSSSTSSCTHLTYSAFIYPLPPVIANPPAAVAKVARVSQLLADFGFQTARSKPKPKPAAPKSAKGKETDPTEIFDGMISNLSNLKVLKGPPCRQPLAFDGVPISSGTP